MFLAKDKGITLVSLVITIIIMLILAGVSLSMVTGDSSVLGQAKKTAFMQEIAGYKEELAISFLGEAAKAQKKIDKAKITARDETSLKRYIPSIKDEDLDDYMIIAGELYYVGDDEFEISVCKEQGYITKPEGMSAEDFADGLETTALEAIILQMAGGEKFMTNNEAGETVTAGVPLAKKIANHGFGSTEGNWKIITELNENDQLVATYADGWYYVTAGTEIEDLGKLRSSYILNYTTKKAVKFDSKKHSIISSNGCLAVENGLVYIADPTNMEDGSAGSWGNAILTGFSGTVKDGNKVISGWADTAFITDGVDDMVEFAPDSNTKYNNGITIEFYGKIIENKANNRYEMIFTKGFSSDLKQVTTLGIDDESDTLWFGYSGHRHWIVPNFDSVFANGKQFFVSYRISNDAQEGVMYLNNEPLTKKPGSGSNTWNDIRAIFDDPAKHFYFGYGRGTGTKLDYSNLAINSIRVYNRYLSDDELTANYNATVSYYNILLNKGEADNNNTGGDDWESIVH